MKLSDKKVHWMEEENWDEEGNPTSFKGIDGFKIDDVKQFIKEILEELNTSEDFNYEKKSSFEIWSNALSLIRNKAGELGE